MLIVFKIKSVLWFQYLKPQNPLVLSAFPAFQRAQEYRLITFYVFVGVLGFC